MRARTHGAKALARMSTTLVVPAASLALAACGASHPASPTGVGSSSAASAKSTAASTTVAAATGQPNSPGVASTAHAAGHSRGARASRRPATVARVSSTQQKRLYSESAHPHLASTVQVTKTATSTGTRHATGRPLVKPVVVVHEPDLGTYVGPANDGTSSCGYVAVGPGMEQAEAFVVQSVDCGTARRVALAASGHTTGSRLQYHALGFSCSGSTASRQALLRYQCTAGSQTVTFQVA